MSKQKVKGSPRPRYGLWLFLGLAMGVLGVGLAFWAFFEPHRPLVFAETAQLLTDKHVFTASYSLDEQRIYTQSDYGHFAVWDASSPSISQVNELSNQNWNPQWNPAQTHYLGIDYEQAAVLFDGSGQRISAFVHPNVYMAFWNPTGDRIVTVSPSETKLWTVDAQLIKEFSQPFNLTDSTLWSPDGRHFAVWINDGENKTEGAIYNADGNELTSIVLDGTPSSYSWNSTSTAFAMMQYMQSLEFQLVVFSAEGQELWRDEFNSEYPQVLWSPDGSVLASFSNSPFGEVLLYSITGELLTQFPTNHIFSWQPHGEILLAGTAEGHEIRLMDAEGTVLHTLPNDNDLSYTYPQWSPNGELIAIWERNHAENVYTLNLWDTAGNLLQQMNSSTPINSVLWSPDSSRILTIGDYVARLWSVADGHEMNSLNHNQMIVYSQWSKDGSRILTTGSYPTSIAYENAIWTSEGAHLTTLFTGDNTGVYVSAWRSDFSQVLLISSQGLSVRNLQAGSIYFDFRFSN